MRRGFVDMPDGQIHYVIEGKGDPVVFLHPSPHAWNYFEACVPYISKEFTFIGMDSVGYGDSSRPAEPYTSIAQYAQSVIWLLDGLGLEKASIVGQLTGAQIGTEVAVSFPDRVDKLVLSEVFNWDTDARRAVHERLHKWEKPDKDGSHLLALWNRFAGRGEWIGLDTVENLFLNAYKANKGQTTDVYGHMNWDGAAPWCMCRYPLWERAALVQAPTLALYGDHSDLRRTLPRVLQEFPRIRAAEYPSRNMGGPIENPSGWSEAVLSFLRNPGI